MNLFHYFLFYFFTYGEPRFPIPLLFLFRRLHFVRRHGLLRCAVNYVQLVEFSQVNLVIQCMHGGRSDDNDHPLRASPSSTNHQYYSRINHFDFRNIMLLYNMNPGE